MAISNNEVAIFLSMEDNTLIQPHLKQLKMGLFTVFLICVVSLTAWADPTLGTVNITASGYNPVVGDAYKMLFLGKLAALGLREATTTETPQYQMTVGVMQNSTPGMLSLDSTGLDAFGRNHYDMVVVAFRDTANSQIYYAKSIGRVGTLCLSNQMECLTSKHLKGIEKTLAKR